MTIPASRPLNFLKGLTRLVLVLAILSLAASQASAQHGGPIGRALGDRARRFYGPDYDARGYADAIGVRGHARLENGGYYGPPQIYSRQYATVFGPKTAPPFVLGPVRRSPVGTDFFGTPVD